MSHEGNLISRMYGSQCFQNKIEIYFYTVQSLSLIKIYRLTAPLCNTELNAEQSKDILIFKIALICFSIAFYSYTVLEHMLHAKLSGFIFSVEENVIAGMLTFN